MEDKLTQPSTQPFYDPRRKGQSGELSALDGSDILLRLHPTTTSAIDAVQACAEHCPQHVYQNTSNSLLATGLDNDIDMELLPAPGQEDDASTQSPPNLSGEWDIALRLSAKVRSIKLGWVFGREKNKCDIILQPPENKRTVRISGMHFRIYVNDEGMVMLEDMSTNGTSVDDVLLRRDNPNRRQRHLEHGSIISVIALTDRSTHRITRVSFMVRFPTRSAVVNQLHTDKLQQYLSRRAGQAPSPGSNMFSGLRSIRSNHGMRWDGGDKYGVVGVVGQGAFATVFQLVDKGTGTVYAAKEIDKMKFMKNGELDTKLGNELRIIKSLAHPHIVKYCDYQDEKDHLYIMMEYVPCGDMSTYMNRKGAVDESICRSVSRQLSQALKYIHDEGVTHRDIKPDNILIANESPMTVKLTDFGLSKLAEGPDTIAMKTFCGTLLYCAPEVYPAFSRLRGTGFAKRQHGSQIGEDGEKVSRIPSTYSRKVDIWSLAAVIFHMVAGTPPYMGTAENQGEMMLRNILSYSLDLTPLHRIECSTLCLDFITSMMKVDPAHRPTAAASLHHPWIIDVPDLEEIPLCRSERDEELQQAVKENEQESQYDSDYDGTGFSSRVAEMNSQVPAGQAVDINRDLSSSDDEDTSFETRPPPPRPPLFGEIRETGMPDSGIFGMGPAPVIEQDAPNGQHTGLQTSQAGNNILSAEAVAALQQSAGLPIIPGEPLILDGDNNSDAPMNGLGQQKPDTQSNDGLQSTVSRMDDLDFDDEVENLLADNPISLSMFASGIKRAHQSQEQELGISKRITMPDRSHALPAESSQGNLLGKLTPTPGSFDTTPLEIRERVTMWGRASRNTHIYKDPMDTRVPKLGMDIVFWRPNIDDDVINGEDWMQLPDINALIFTRATRGISVNGKHLSVGDGTLLCGKLRTGDCIEIFSEAKKGQYLRFDCEFYHGDSAASRGEDEKFSVEPNKELYEIATSSRSQDQ